MPKKQDKQRRPSVAIIGYGRLGQALAIALSRIGYNVAAVVVRRTTKGKGLSLLKRTNSPIILGADQLTQLPKTDLTIIAIPDDAIEQMARQLAAIQVKQSPGKTRRRTVLHTSGALSSEVLSPLKRAGFHTGSLHPLVSVSEARAGARSLRGAFYCLEGTPPAMRVARSIVKDLDGTSFAIPPRTKALYHAAAVMTSGHLVALFDLATEMLATCGLGEENARRILLPLVASTLKNLKSSEPSKALTGTFARGDLATVKRHLQALTGKGTKKLERAFDVYRLLGLQSLKLAEQNKLDTHLLEEIIKTLNSSN